MKGKIPVQSKSLFSQLMQGDLPVSRMSLVGDQISKYFNPTYVTERATDEAGNLKHSIPTGFTGSFKDMDKIGKLKDELAAIDTTYNRDTATKAQQFEYKKVRKEKAAELKAEEQKLMPHQIQKDLGKLLIDMTQKIAVFNADSRIEDKVLMIREAAALKSERMELAQKDAEGRPLFKRLIDSTGISLKRLLGSGSNELQMIDDVLDMVMYHEGEYPKSFMAKLEKFGISLKAINAFLINPPVSFGVSLMIKSIHLREGAVGGFFHGKQFAKSEYLMNSDTIPKWLANNAVKAMGGPGKKYASYMEAWAEEIQAFNKGMSDDAVGVRRLLQLEHFVEWSGTVTGAVAIGLNTPIKGKDGQISNAYECFDELPDGSIKVKDNYKEAWDAMKKPLSRRMSEYQNRYHGAYTELGRATITQYPFGNSLMFLKKWIPATLQSTFGSRYTHSNLGVQEGRYITSINAVNDFLKTKGSIQEKYEQGLQNVAPKGSIGNPDWDKMTPEEQQAADDKAYESDPNFKGADGQTDWKKVERDRDTRKMELLNLKRTIFDMVYVMIAYAFQTFKYLAQQTDDTEGKRWSNFLAKSFDRLRKQSMFAMPVVGLQQQYSLLKSPIASLSIMGDFADAFAASAGLVVPPYGDNYYTTGVHKGELKAWVKTEQILPGLNVIKEYKELSNPTYWTGR